MADDRKSPLAQALDLLLYAPLGLALTAREELPKLAEKGRQRTTQQMMMAKMIGQFAVTQGRQELENRLTAMTAPPTPRPTTPEAPQPTAEPAAPASAPTAAREPANGRNGSAAINGSAPKVTPSVPAPPVETLAIPGYDSLSASQVVQRLAGLSAGELEQVAAYEEGNRGRRTILSKVAMLQAERT